MVKASAIDTSRLKLEITESMVVNIESAIAKMDALRNLGLRFSMDDFGTGFSSLSSLSRLPLHQIKIDQSFVQKMVTSVRDEMLVKTIIGMAHTLGLKVIAEGVETKEQRDLLETHGCLMYQGYFFSRPVPLEAFQALLT
jgi:EAL domain-containing protein (putative c-di-GMP-specific phosphodiesterase class I)